MLSARDDALPNANATMMSNLSALYLLTGDVHYRDLAEALRKALAGEAMQIASLHTGFFGGLADHFSPQHIVVMRGDGEAAMRDALTHISLPGAVVQWLSADGELSEHSPAFGKRAVEGKATAYICLGPQCSPPVSEPKELLAALQTNRTILSS